MLLLQLVLFIIAIATSTVLSFVVSKNDFTSRTSAIHFCCSTLAFGKFVDNNPRRRSCKKVETKFLQVVLATTTTIKSSRRSNPKATTTTTKLMMDSRNDSNANTNNNNKGEEVEEPSTTTTNTEVVGQMFGGLVFLKTKCREDLVEFYTKRIGMSIWLEQPNITICNHGNLILGFHQCTTNDDNDLPDLQGMYTFVYPSKDDVDTMYNKLQDIADGPPRINSRYQIYQFFAIDPENRKLEFQVFLHPLTTVSSKVVVK